MKLITALWADESGLILSAELALIATVGILGLSVMLVAVRDSIGAELTDLSEAFRSLDQSYGYGGLLGCETTHGFSSFTAGSKFLDSTLREAGSEQDIIVADYVVGSSRPRHAAVIAPPLAPIVVSPSPCGHPDCVRPNCRECPQPGMIHSHPPLIAPDVGIPHPTLISPIPETRGLSVPCDDCPSGVNQTAVPYAGMVPRSESRLGVILPAPGHGVPPPRIHHLRNGQVWTYRDYGYGIPTMPAGPLQVW